MRLNEIDLSKLKEQNIKYSKLVDFVDSFFDSDEEVNLTSVDVDDELSFM